MGYAPDQLAPLSDVRQEGLRLVHAAAERGLPVRLIGGVAVWAQARRSRSCSVITGMSTSSPSVRRRGI